jgi:hypothetical protein
MSDETIPGPEEQTPPPGPEAAGSAPSAPGSSTDPMASEASSPVTDEALAPAAGTSRTRRFIAIGAVAAGVLGVGGIGAYAYTALSGGGAQPQDVLPASALAYGRVDLDPSAAQKVELLRLLQKLPDLESKIGDVDADLRKLVVENAFGQDCTVDFDADVEPWMGQRFGVAVLSEPLEPVVAIQVDDEDAARTGIAELVECAGEEASGVGFLDGYAIVGKDQKTVDAAVEAAAEEPLADNPEFSEAIDALGDQGVASGWVDYGALLAHPELTELAAEGAELSGQPAFEIPDVVSDLGSATFVLRAESSAIELRGVFEGSGELLGDPIDVSQLSDTTVAALGSSLSDESAKAYTEIFKDSLAAEGLDAETTAGIEEVAGVSLDEIFTLFTSDPLITVGERGLDSLGSITGPEGVSGIDVALRTRGDQAELSDIVERLAEAGAGLGGVELVVGDVEGGAALATSQSALETGSPLSASETFRSVVPFDAPTSLFYLDLDKLQPVVEQFATGDESVVTENLGPLRAFATSSAGDEFSMRLTFDD